MPFDAYSGSSGHWSYANAGVTDPDEYPELLYDLKIPWTINSGDLEPDGTIYAWRINNSVGELVHSLNYKCECSDEGIVYPEIAYYGGTGSWNGTLSGICSQTQFRPGQPLIASFLFHENADIGRKNCRIIVSSLEEYTAVTEQTAKFTINFIGSGLLSKITPVPE
jgi:hypothetical protein